MKLRKLLKKIKPDEVVYVNDGGDTVNFMFAKDARKEQSYYDLYVDQFFWCEEWQCIYILTHFDETI